MFSKICENIQNGLLKNLAYSLLPWIMHRGQFWVMSFLFYVSVIWMWGHFVEVYNILDSYFLFLGSFYPCQLGYDIICVFLKRTCLSSLPERPLMYFLSPLSCVCVHIGVPITGCGACNSDLMTLCPLPNLFCPVHWKCSSVVEYFLTKLWSLPS